MAIGNSGYISSKVKTSKQNGEVFGVNRMFDVYNARLVDKWVFAPVVRLTLSSTSLNETDNRLLEVDVAGAGYEDGTELFWTVQGVSGTVNSSDFSTGFTGSFQLSGSLASSSGAFEVRVRADGTADGQDQFVVQVREGSTSGAILTTSETVTIEDSSIILTRPDVTGGTITTSGGYTYHTFTSNGTLEISGGTLTDADYLLVGGGGGNGTSGSYFSGGGGAGGYRSFTLQELSDGTYPVTIGAGGTTGNGTATTFNSLSAAGGGASQRSGVTANSGGSGGGGGSGFGSTASGGAGNTPSTSPSQGNNGGNGTSFSNGAYSSGGGGGAGAAGVAATRSSAGNGGVGLQWLNGTFYAGGGGGAAYWEFSGAITRGVGGQGGGGNGFLAGPATNSSTELPNSNGAANTGGGGGASDRAGGSGVFILRYPE